MIWVLILPLALIAFVLVFMFGYTRGLDDIREIGSWGIGFDKGWDSGWDCGFDRGFLCGIQENQKNRTAYKTIDREEA